MEPAPAAEAVLEAFGLRGTVVSMTAVAGAWSNRVHRLETTRSAFAVKEMRNPWGQERWREWLDEAWAFELRAREAGVPAPEPIPSRRVARMAVRWNVTSPYSGAGRAATPRPSARPSSAPAWC